MSTRADAWSLVEEYVKNENLRKHMLSVEAAMRAYAKKFGQDAEAWGQAGLLHDFDYERWPNPNLDQTGHPFTGVPILREKGFSEEIIQSILGHADYSGVPRASQMAKTLYAVDEISGFVMAVAYVRPEKFNGLAPKSVKKKLKDKSFAAAVSREDIARGIQELGVDETEHIQLVIDAMGEIAPELGF